MPFYVNTSTGLYNKPQNYAPAPYASASYTPQPLIAGSAMARFKSASAMPYSGDIFGSIANAIGGAVNGLLGTPQPLGQGTPDSTLPTIMTTASFVNGRRYAAGVQAPDVPVALISSQIDMLPGFTGANVYPIANFPGTVPEGAAPGANFVITATRSGPTVNDQPLPPNVLWVVDYLPDVPTPVPDKPAPGGVPVPDKPSASSQASAPILGMQPMTFGLVALGVIVGGVLLVSHYDSSTRVHARG